MKNLLELAQVVTPQKLRNVRLLGSADQQDTLLNDFYYQLSRGAFQSDDEAAATLFNSDGAFKPYQKLKSKLKYRLLDALFLIDHHQPSYDTLETAYLTCWKEWAAAKILMARGALNAALELAEKVLQQAVRFEIVDLVPHVARTLRMYYADRRADNRRFDYYNDLLKTYSEMLHVETLAEEYNHALMLRLAGQRATSPELSREAWGYYEELAPYLNRYDTVRLQRFIRFIRVIAEMSVGDYEAAVRTCDEAVAFIRRKEFLPKNALVLFLYNKVACCTQLRRFEDGRVTAEEGLALEVPGSFNWFKNREVTLILALHAQRYQEAYGLFLQAVQHARFSKLDAITQETWKIYEAYIYYLILVQRVTPRADDRTFSKFRLARFINELPVFSRDKRGMNIPILVIQILFNVAQRKYSTAINRIEAIEKYCSRYLYRDDNYRSNCFIRMLLQIPQNNFHPAAVQRKAEKYLRRLVAHPLEIANQAHEIEIIPYEDLWNMVTASLRAEFSWPTPEQRPRRKRGMEPDTQSE